MTFGWSTTPAPWMLVFFFILLFPSSSSFLTANFYAFTIGCFLFTSVSQLYACFIATDTPTKHREIVCGMSCGHFSHCPPFKIFLNDVAPLDTGNDKLRAPRHSWWNLITFRSTCTSERDDWVWCCKGVAVFIYFLFFCLVLGEKNNSLCEPIFFVTIES